MKYLKRSRTRKLVSKFGMGLAITALLVFSLFPFFWAISSSLRSGVELFSPRLWPLDPTLKNYVEIFRAQPFAKNLLNSILVATTSVGLAMVVALFAAYALGRMEFRGRQALLLSVLGISMFPQIAVLSGLYTLIQGLGLYNRWFGLTLSYLIFTVPFTLWMLTTFIQQIPKSLEEAAIMDKASTWTIVTRIFVPLLAPAFVTTGLLCFMLAWNEFLFALTFTLSNESRTVPVATALMSGSSQFELPWGQVTAAAVVVTLPVIALVLFFQKRIVSGLMAGAVKG